jgi:signal transduction histidine kinase
VKIAHKGLILVAVPLACELFFVGVLVSLHQQAEAEVQREVRSRSIIEKADQLIIDVLSAGTATTTYGLNVRSRDTADAAVAKYETALKDVEDQFRALVALCRNRPDQMSILEKTFKLYKRYDRITNAVREAYDGHEVDKAQRNMFVFLSIKQLNECLDEICNNMNQLLVTERRVAVESPQAQARNRQNIEYALFGGIAFNILLAGAMAIFFSRDIAERLKVIVINTRKLERREQLNPPIKGTDEIAYLDGALHETATKLGELDRLKSEFVSMVSHDLRTPLTSILGLMDFLETGMLGELNEMGKRHVSLAEQDIERLIGLINDLLDVDRLETGSLELNITPVPLSDLLARSVAAVAGVAATRKINISVPETPVSVLGDNDRLVQVFVNVLSNALKFSPEGSSVEIALTDHEDAVEIRIADHGPGIAAEDLSAVFDRFKQVGDKQARKKGTGLGLAICKAIVQQHQGEIGVESELGKGATFWVRLPKARNQDRQRGSTAVKMA